MTPDSFSGDGLLGDREGLERQAREMQADGADILDVGGESTRPGFRPLSVEEEIERIVPAFTSLAAHTRVPLSVDTSKPEVASAALRCGATVINDVTGGRDRRMLEVAAEYDAHLVIVHGEAVSGGDDLMSSVLHTLEVRIREAVDAGVRREHIIVDPGLGFGKGWRENFLLLRRLPELRSLDAPVLVGPSRKGMIGRVLGVDVGDRVEGTLALVSLAIAGGADMIRVHDVRPMARAARMTDAIVRPRESDSR